MARWLLGRNLEGHATNLARVGDQRARDLLLDVRAEALVTEDARALRKLEATAADTQSRVQSEGLVGDHSLRLQYCVEVVE
ncbi:MAG: hypothetical protein J2P45_03265 [Candidatus Dormibacteraeota bacterium]|nr:hypothetical protein [Candidatus Dormibacteraeota bacterium]